MRYTASILNLVIMSVNQPPSSTQLMLWSTLSRRKRTITPVGPLRSLLQSPVHNGLIAVMLRCPATFTQEPPVGPRRSLRRRAWVIRNQNAHAGDRTRAAQGVAERSFRALHPAVAQAPMRAKIFAPDHPIFFLKPSTRLVGHLQPIVARTQNMGFHPIIYRRELAGMRRCSQRIRFRFNYVFQKADIERDGEL